MIKAAYITQFFYPDIHIAAQRAMNFYRHLNRYLDMRLEVLTDSLNLEARVQNKSRLDTGGVIYLHPYRNNFQKNIFRESTSFFKLLNKTLFLGRREKGLAAAIRRHPSLEKYGIYCVSVGPFRPFLELAGHLKRTYPGKKVIVEYRDIWVEGLDDFSARHNFAYPYSKTRSLYQKIAKNYGLNRRAAECEREVLPLVDRIVVVSEEMIKYFRQRMPGLDPGKFLHIPLGLDEEETRAPADFREHKKPPGDHLSILYAGSLGNRDLRPLLESIHRLRREGKVGKNQIRLTIIGRNGFYAKYLPQEYRSFVTFRASVPRAEILKEYQKHDLLLLLINDWPKAETTMTGKIFELIESRRPILALLPLAKDGCARRLLEKTNSAFLAEVNDPAQTGALLERMVELKRQQQEISLERKNMTWFHENYSYGNICRKLYLECLRLTAG